MSETQSTDRLLKTWMLSHHVPGVNTASSAQVLHRICIQCKANPQMQANPKWQHILGASERTYTSRPKMPTTATHRS